MEEVKAAEETAEEPYLSRFNAPKFISSQTHILVEGSFPVLEPVNTSII